MLSGGDRTDRGQCEGMPLQQRHFGTVQQDVLTGHHRESGLLHPQLKHVRRMFYNLFIRKKQSIKVLNQIGTSLPSCNSIRLYITLLSITFLSITLLSITLLYITLLSITLLQLRFQVNTINKTKDARKLKHCLFEYLSHLIEIFNKSQDVI